MIVSANKVYLRIYHSEPLANGYVLPSSFKQEKFNEEICKDATSLFNFFNSFTKSELIKFFTLNEWILFDSILYEDVKYTFSNIKPIDPNSDKAKDISEKFLNKFDEKSFLYIEFDILFGEYENFYSFLSKLGISDELLDQREAFNFAMPSNFVRETQKLKQNILSKLGQSNGYLNALKEYFCTGKSVMTDELCSKFFLDEFFAEDLAIYSSNLFGTVMIISALNGVIEHKNITKADLYKAMEELYLALYPNVLGFTYSMKFLDDYLLEIKNS